jgi:hypothetical protein
MPPPVAAGRTLFVWAPLAGGGFEARVAQAMAMTASEATRRIRMQTSLG